MGLKFIFFLTNPVQISTQCQRLNVHDRKWEKTRKNYRDIFTKVMAAISEFSVT